MTHDDAGRLARACSGVALQIVTEPTRFSRTSAPAAAAAASLHWL